jgi:hypothetical protein
MKLFAKTKGQDAKPLNARPSWQLKTIIIVLFPIILFLSQLSPLGLEFMTVLNDGSFDWDWPTAQQAVALAIIFLVLGIALLPMIICSGACMSILIKRASGEDQNKQ